MKYLTGLLLAVALLAPFTATLAEDFDDDFGDEENIRYAWFGGIQGGGAIFDFTETPGNKPNPDIGFLRLAKMYEHFAFEARIGGHTGVRSSGRYAVNASYGIYLEPRIPLGRRAGLYLLGGYGAIDFDTEAFSGVTGSSATYGAGLWLATTRRFRIELEKLRLYEKKAIKIDAISLGFTYDF